MQTKKTSALSHLRIIGIIVSHNMAFIYHTIIIKLRVQFSNSLRTRKTSK